MNGNYIKLFRKLQQWEWYQNSNMVHLFVHLLLSANWKDGRWQGIDVHRGQFVTGRKSLHDQTGISEQIIRTCLSRLESSGEIITKPTNKFTIVTICNYDDYQEEQPANNQQTTNKQPTNNQQITTIEEVKEERRRKKKYGEFKNVLLTEEELNKLQERFTDYEERIERLSVYVESTGKKYKSHYATILSWSRKEKPKCDADCKTCQNRFTQQHTGCKLNTDSCRYNYDDRA